MHRITRALLIATALGVFSGRVKAQFIGGHVADAGAQRAVVGALFGDTLRLTDDGFVQQQFRYDSTAQRIYYPFEVAKIVMGVVGSRAPRYPDDLRKLGVKGEVIARFVVDITGHMVAGTFTATSASDSRFVPAVLDALQDYNFYPAQLPNGRKVRQYVFMPFQFESR